VEFLKKYGGQMIGFKIGDMTKMEVDILCNASNGLGYMGGGIAGALLRSGGQEIENEAIKACDPPFKAGQAYITSAGKLKANHIIHMVTMDLPGGETSLEICKKALISGLNFTKDGDSIAITALGTGVGGLNKEEVAKMMMEELNKYKKLDIYVVDINSDFINYCKAYNVS
jgi:O-acetyl-ADP-ribose deacetylase (regulator of RNase III)